MTGPEPRLLVVDDDPAVVALLVELLGTRYAVEGTVSAHAALERVSREDLDVVIADIEMPEMRGPDLLAAIHERKPGQMVLLITAFGSIELAVQTMRAGACDFVTKPFKSETLVFAIERALRERKMRREIVRLRRELGAGEGGLVATSAPMRRVLDVAARAARSDATILITGESGVGKGAVARWIHERGPRQAGPFVQVNCAALPSGLIEAELFGVRRGAFTDARESREGLFVEATGGTILLDEIAEMTLDAQAKLLRVLEASCVRAVGAVTDVPTDARVIAATNQKLDDAIKGNRFRLDLFYRLNVIPIEVPPLRERLEDIPELVQAILARAARGAPSPIGISEEAMRWLARHDWPGNVRQLANVIERAVALTEHDTIVLEDVREMSEDLGAGVPDLLAEAAERHLSLEDVETGYIQRVLAMTGGNVSRAARILGIDRRTLHRKLAGT